MDGSNGEMEIEKRNVLYRNRGGIMVTLQVYLVDGRVYSYEVANSTKAREHAHRIINYGWRNIEEGRMCYYPIWQVLKVCWDTKDENGLEGKYFAQPGLTANQKTNIN